MSLPESPLRQYRKSVVLSQMDLAALANVTQAHISHVENGTAAIDGNLKKYLRHKASEIAALQDQQRDFMKHVKRNNS